MNNLKQLNQFYTNGIWKIESVVPESHRKGRHGVFINEIRINAPLILMYVNNERGKVDELYGKCLQTSLVEKITINHGIMGYVGQIEIKTMNSVYTLVRVL